jgi:hypothetical protein
MKECILCMFGWHKSKRSGLDMITSEVSNNLLREDGEQTVHNMCLEFTENSYEFGKF